MQIISQPNELQCLCQQWRLSGQTIALVPTMGYYHSGHADLIAHARSLANKLVVSLFINPTQFGPNEDFANYPKDHAKDQKIAEKLGCDVLFMPTAETMYTPDHDTWVEVPKLSQGLCGLLRPNHFKGVCTVVLKLFNLTAATIAVFGQKDWQQQAILKKMVKDLNVPIQIVTRPTVREDDGLALSSRNVYLNEDERKQAPYLYQALKDAQTLVLKGEKSVSCLCNYVLQQWAQKIPLSTLDYLTVVDPETLTPLTQINGPALMACAVRLGRARLIDNILLIPSNCQV
ncbi:MAG: pantoate--beta-alanine ligase [Desulfovibrio sp.]|nr:pantoate--beta-alanine ligase [Desulfovibrio sp.]